MTKKIGLISIAFIFILVAWTGQSIGQGVRQGSTDGTVSQKNHSGDIAGTGESDGEDGNGEALMSEQDKKMLEVARSLAHACTDTLTKWVSSNEITEERLFSYLYYPIEHSNPTKFTTDYDSYADRDLPKVLNAHLGMEADTIYAVLSDRNGYIPTHNLKYNQPVTGDLEKDLINSRQKRIYADKIGLTAARSLKTYLIQSYRRDTGQFLTDLSIPVIIDGKHWGAIRIGYLRDE
jgi:hypothetical protein